LVLYVIIQLYPEKEQIHSESPQEKQKRVKDIRWVRIYTKSQQFKQKKETKKKTKKENSLETGTPESVFPFYSNPGIS